MDPNAVNQNITVDGKCEEYLTGLDFNCHLDFDSVITYENQSIWLTPDPSKSLPFNQSNTPWFAGTYHVTNVTNTSFTFNFDGEQLLVHMRSLAHMLDPRTYNFYIRSCGASIRVI